MRHFAILISGGGRHSVVFLLTALTPLDALFQYLRYEDSQLTFNDDGTVDDRHERIHYEHPLAYIEEAYRSYGEWQLREFPERAFSEPCAEIACGERPADIEGYVEQCRPLFRKSHPRSRARAFVWYLRSGPLVTFYRKKGRYRVEVLARYLLDLEQRRGFIPWTGTHPEIFDQLWLGPWKIDP
jgi:hypothetical protein